ncbi:MAG: TonB-dependent receptor [Bacteroidetes bacterium]|nr:MAG: TonB-dependent receptor [Bacteroidota bacterium]
MQVTRTVFQFSTILCALFFSTSLLSQGTGTVKGFIHSESSGEAVMFASVSLEGTSHGVITDVSGFYSLSKVPSGEYNLIVSSIEFENVREKVSVISGKVLTKNYLLKDGVVQLGGAEVSADSEEQRNSVRMSVETIRPADIKHIPSFGGQADLVQVLQVLPGFVSTGDQGGQLYIRGGSPIQNKVLLDGMIVYNAFHSIGLFSVFDSDALANADIYTGAFSAKYGGRISSVMDIKTKDGNMREQKVIVGASPFGAKIMLEGPLKKMTDKAGGISYLVSMKHSYLEKTSQFLYPYIDGGKLPFGFTDTYGKITFGGAGSKLSLFGFGFSDHASVLDDSTGVSFADYGWKNVGGGGNFTIVPPGSAVLVKGHFAISSYGIGLEEGNLSPRYSNVNGFNFGLDFKYVLGDDNVEYGLEVVGLETDYKTFNALNVIVEQTENTTEFGGYIDYTISRGKLIVQPSIRMQYYSSLAKFRPEPRIGMKYKFNERLRLKLAAGMYSQNVISANSDRDVVNLFYGFLAGPENLQSEFVTPSGQTRAVSHSLQTANHVVAGFEYDITEFLNLNVEGYLKQFTQLTNTNRQKLFPDDADHNDVPELLRLDYIIESGFAQGVDMVLKFEQKFTYLWLVYGLGNVDRWDGSRWYDPVFDRRHNVNLVASQDFGKNQEWQASARWSLGSGLPFTQSQGYYQSPNVTDGISSDYITQNAGDITIYYAGLNQGRLPTYHRLDLSVKRTFKDVSGGDLDFTAGITNVYSRENVFYINRITGQRKNQLPFLPSIAIDWKF